MTWKRILTSLGAVIAGVGSALAAATPAVAAHGSVPGPVPSTATRWTALAAGWDHTCAIAAGGSLWCWGVNYWGDLGDGSNTQRTSPVRVQSSVRWAMVAAGGAHTCGVDRAGGLWCWGGNAAGRIGDGTTIDRVTPVRIQPDTRWSMVAAGGNHTCAVDRAGGLWCWGDNNVGQVGDGTYDDHRLVPTRIGVGVTWARVATGASHSCAVDRAGGLWCWGSGSSGKLGYDDAPGAELTPHRVGADTTWATVTGGDYHTCATRVDGTLWCWGGNIYGQLGDGTAPREQHTLVQIASAVSWASVATAWLHTCGTGRAGGLLCWGDNASGQLGDGTTTDRSLPTSVRADIRWTAVSTGATHTCAIDAHHQLLCWGSNGVGQLGDGTTQNRPTPAPVAEPPCARPRS